jgi:hypothetical protein
MTGWVPVSLRIEPLLMVRPENARTTGVAAGAAGTAPSAGAGSPVSPHVLVHVPPVDEETNASVVHVPGIVTGATGVTEPGTKLLGT